MKAIHLSLVASAIVAVGGACSSFENASIPPPAEDAAVDAADAGVEAAVINGAPPGCDATALPTQSDCVVYEGLGVFVSTSLGPQAGDGTRAKPYRTLQQGIDAAKTASKRVYACAETYSESVTLANGVSVFGYFDCAANWAVSTTKRAKIAAPASPAMKAATLPLPVRIEGFEIQAPAGTAQATSSIVIQANDAADLRFVNAKIVAQKAADGANGVDGVQLTNGSDIDGEANVAASLCNLASCFVVHGGGVGGTNTCVGATGFTGGTGGHGGYGGHWSRAGGWTMVDNATNGGDGTPSYGPVSGQGGTQSLGGFAGHYGIDGSNGASSAGAGFGPAGFVPGAGVQGGHGSPGQGGGGGTGYPPNPATSIPQGEYYGASGAGGGAGGCPGVAGSPGGGGGASIGVVSWNSALHFESTTITAADGGKGGVGTWGSQPTSGGVGGVRDNASAPECTAGGGAPGGRSGVSGHGAGGHSIGIAYKGTASELSTDSTITIGAAGLGQVAQQKVFDVTKNIGASPAGQAKAQFAIP